MPTGPGISRSILKRCIMDSIREEGTIESTDAVASSRRSFLQQVASVGAVVAGSALSTACASSAAAAPAAGVRPSASAWDMSWQQKLGKYRTVYDSPEINFAGALHYASAAASGYKDALGVERDFTPVLVLRHAATVMVLNDSMWKRLALGESTKMKDPTTGEPAQRNPFIRYADGDKHSLVGAGTALDRLMEQGAVVLTCNRALTGIAYQLRQKETQYTPATALDEVRRNVIPGVYVMPNGIFAVSAAQDAGCHYMRVLL